MKTFVIVFCIFPSIFLMTAPARGAESEMPLRAPERTVGRATAANASLEGPPYGANRRTAADRDVFASARGKQKAGRVLLQVVTPLLAVAMISAIVGFKVHSLDGPDCSQSTDAFCEMSDLGEEIGVLFSAAFGFVSVLTTAVIGGVLLASGDAKLNRKEKSGGKKPVAGPVARLGVGVGRLSLRLQF